MTTRRYALSLDDEEHARLRAQAAGAVERERELWARLGVGPGARVADLGCGPAATLLGLVDLVGSSGELVGVDSAPEAVRRARTAVDAAGAAGTIEVVEGLAWDSGLPAERFDGVIVRLVLVHNGGHERAIVDHALSLLRPGGWVYLFDIDMTLIRVEPPTAPVSELFERLEAFERRRGNDVAVGQRLGELLLAAGAELVEHHGRRVTRPRGPGQRGPAWAAREAMVAAGEATEPDVARWDEEFRALDERVDQPAHVSVGFTAIGRRPPAV